MKAPKRTTSSGGQMVITKVEVAAVEVVLVVEKGKGGAVMELYRRARERYLSKAGTWRAAAQVTDCKVPRLG